MPNSSSALAEAELAMGNYITARTQLRALVRQQPDEALAAQRLDMVEQVIALDPLVRRQPGGEAPPQPPPLLKHHHHAETCGAVDAVGEQLEAARKQAEEPYQRATAETAFERNLQTAERLWRLLPGACRSTTAGAEHLTHVYARLERESR
jgi:hypothetical protein